MGLFRENHQPKAFEQMTKGLLLLTQEENFGIIFLKFRKIFEFIIHMHKVYNIPLTLNETPEKNEILLKTMHSVICKFENCFEIMPKIVLTPLPSVLWCDTKRTVMPKIVLTPLPSVLRRDTKRTENAKSR
jgi:hypothetical protein